MPAIIKSQNDECRDFGEILYLTADEVDVCVYNTDTHGRGDEWNAIAAVFSLMQLFETNV